MKKNKNLAVIKKALSLEPDQILITFSAETGEGVDDVKESLEEILTPAEVPEAEPENE